MRLLSFSILFISVLFGCQSQTSQVVQLKASEFKQKFEQEGGILLDVRTPQEVSSGRLEDASTIDFYDSDFKKKLDKIQKDKAVFVYCKSGGRSAKAASMLVELGVGKVYNLKGGVMAWKRAGLPLVEDLGTSKSQLPKTTVEDLQRHLSQEENVLVYFHTQWCVPCCKLAPIIDNIEQTKEGALSIVKVDIDQSESCADFWQIGAVPTLILFQNDKEVWRHTGFIDHEQLLSKLSLW